MLSFHPNKSLKNTIYGQGFKTDLAGSMERVGKFMLHFVWSPIVWRDGVRVQSGFFSCDLCALDFDSGELTLEQAIIDFSDMTHVIGTTRNHRKSKNGGPICDRFRVVLKFDKTINELRHYRYNLFKYSKLFPVDKACVDGARFFYPCNEIVSINEDGFKADIFPSVPDDFENQKIIDVDSKDIARFHQYNQLPLHIYAFLEFGKEFGGGRNISCYSTAIFLLSVGLSIEKTIKIIREAPFSRENFKESEIISAVKSAYKNLKEA